MPDVKADWPEMERRVAEFPDKDRAAVRTFMKHRRDIDMVAPGTMRNDLQRLTLASKSIEGPLVEAAKDGTFERWATEYVRENVKSDPWFVLGRYRLFLVFHDLPHEWTVAPKKGPTTRKKRARMKRTKRWRVVPHDAFRAAVRRCASTMHRAQLYLLWEMGLRPSELLSLRYGDVETDSQGHLYVQLPPEEEALYSLKTGPRRMVVIESAAALKEWLNAHPTQEEDAPLWPGDKGDRMSLKKLQTLVRVWTPDHTAKDFRHTAATRATIAGWNEAQMRAYFGWEPASTMPSYYAEFTEADANRARLRRAGLLSEDGEAAEKEHFIPVKCPRCYTENVRENVHCHGCGGPLRPELIRAAREREAEDFETRMLRLLDRAEKDLPDDAPTTRLKLLRHGIKKQAKKREQGRAQERGSA